MKQAPIGIFDSGMGGLTNARAIHQLLPHESLIYVADILHLPYGDKTTAQIQSYALSITDWLLAQGCKMIVIACNAVASSAEAQVRQRVGDRAIVVDVISPAVEYVSQHYTDKNVGLIATRRTIDSQVYPQRLTALNNKVTLHSLATPLLVPFIEHHEENQDCHELLESYLSTAVLQNIDALILGCTHYPLIKNQIQVYYHNQVKIIDSCKLVANLVKEKLQEKKILNDNNTGKITQQFFTTQESPQFAKLVQSFFAVKAEFLKI